MIKITWFVMSAALALVYAAVRAGMPTPVLCLFGGFGTYFVMSSAIATYLSSNPEDGENVAQSVISGLLQVMIGMLMLMAASGRHSTRDPYFVPHLLIGVFTCCVGAGISVSRSVSPPEIRIGRALGFTPVPAGPRQKAGGGMKAVIKGLDVTLDISYSGEGAISACYVKVSCLVANPLKLRLRVYPAGERTPDRPQDPLPPVIEGMPSWGYFTVRGEPAAEVSELLNGVKAGEDNVFQENSGLIRTELERDALFCEFKTGGVPDAGIVKRMVDATVSLAGKFC